MQLIQRASVALAAFTALACASVHSAHAADADQAAAGASIQLAHRLVDSASAYETFMHKAGSISPAFTDGASVAQAVRTGAAWEPKQMLEGEIAYAAIVALQDPAFVQSVRELAADPAMHERVISDLLSNPNAVTRIRDTDGAAALAASALGQQGERLLASGKSVKQAAYDVQHQSWSKSDVSNPDGRLAEAKVLSATRLTPTGEDTGRLMKAALDTRQSLSPSERRPIAEAAPAYTPVVVRGLAVAAMALMGEAGDDKVDRLEPLLSEAHGADCMKMAKLNLFQCLAVARPHYEDIFCLGEHGMMETGRCVLASVTPPRSQSVMQVARAPEAPPAPAPVAVLTSVSA